MSDATPQNNQPNALGRLASWGLLAGTAVAAVYIGIPVLAATASFAIAHTGVALVAAAAIGGTGYANKSKLGGVKNFFANTAKLYKQAFATARNDWKSALGWGKAKAAERAAEAAAPKAPANDDAGASKLAGASSKAAFKGATSPAEAKPAAAAPAPKKTAGLDM